MRYCAVIEKEDGSCYGVSFPDVPGCFSAGDTLEEAIANSKSALILHLADSPWPPARRMRELVTESLFSNPRSSVIAIVEISI